jgi:hypothetical protein
MNMAASAEPAAVVEAMQMPAWIERGAQRTPLVVGYGVESGDRIHTGRDARVLLKLQEGSHIKLGEQAQFNVDALATPKDSADVFKGVVDVLNGAFRFTTSALGALHHRQIQARISTVTIGIRGTDVWGKADSGRDFVVLLEGKIDIARDGESAQRMETPMSIFSAPKNAATEAVVAVDPNALQKWAQETELQPGAGVMTGDGRWAVAIAASAGAPAANSLATHMQAAGYAVDIDTVGTQASPLSHVKLSGFTTQADAERVRQRLVREFGLNDGDAVLEPSS